MHASECVCVCMSGVENSTRPLVFTSRASENFEISSENQILPIYANNFCDAGQVSIFRYFEACMYMYICVLTAHSLIAQVFRTG